MIWALRNWQLVLIGALAFTLGLIRVRSSWVNSRLEKAQARNKTLQADVDAHERMNDAEIGSDLSDAERVRRLHALADKLDRD